jgi:hypothetical protein
VNVTRHLALGVLLFSSLAHSPVGAQEVNASAGEIAGGAVLGAYSGSMMGLVGGVGVCSRALLGARCPRIAAALGGAIGAASGAVMAAETEGNIEGRWKGAGYGALIGGGVAYALSRGIRQYQWPDVGAIAGVGAAVGASPAGAGIGFGAGAAIGAVAWLASSKFTVGDVVAVSLVGLAAGGWAGWIVGAAEDPPQAPIVIPFQIRF